MGDLDDYRLGSNSGERSAGSSNDGGAGTASSPPWALVGILAAVVLAVVAWFWFFRRPAPQPTAEEPAAAAPAPATDRGRVEEETLETLELPELDASDEVVRELVAKLSSHPTLIRWIANEDLVRRAVAAVDNLAEGQIPRPHVGFAAPRGDFRAVPRGERKVVDPASYARFDLTTEVFTSLDTEGMAKLYSELEPLIREAYRDLGYPNRDFRETIRQAVEVVLETPRPPDEVEVVEGVSSFRFADPRLEGLLPAQKQLLRFGPDNLNRVQAKTRALADALGIR